MATNSDKPVAVVTGAASGIGYEIALAFGNAGYTVALVDLSGDTAKHAAEKLSVETGARIVGFACDVADEAACEVAYENIVLEFGPVDVLVNNAGIMPQQKGWIEQLPSEEFVYMMKVHVGGAMNWCSLVLPNMRTAGFGRIINMSSATALLAVPHRLAYVTAKKAILGLTEALALDCARAGITVNAIAPGWVLTDILKKRAEQGILNIDDLARRTPVGRWARPDEIARMALFLADPDSAYITGTTMRVDGGLCIRGDADEDIDHSPFAAA